MGYTREERLDIGKQIYNNEISKGDAAIKYRISEGTARDYMRLYRDVNGLPPKNRIQKDDSTVRISVHSSEPDLSEYESMTKEELIKKPCEHMKVIPAKENRTYDNQHQVCHPCP